jgi:hypothetical protein
VRTKRPIPIVRSPESLRTFSALLESVRDDVVVLIVVPENQRVRFPATPVMRMLLKPCLLDPMGEVFTVTVHGNEIVNFVPATPR